MKQTINYKFIKPDLTDVVDIEVLNTNMDTIDLELNKKSNIKHTHTKSEITDFPKTLPADGGIADSAKFSKALMQLDKRNTNEAPSYYIKNHYQTSVLELKDTSAIGLEGNVLCEMITYTPWEDTTGGYPVQEAHLGTTTYKRIGQSTSVWGTWIKTNDGGNANMLSGKGRFDFLEKVFLTAHTVDFYTYLDGLSHNNFPSYGAIVVRTYNCTNMPYDSGDFICYVSSVSPQDNRTYCTVLALDVRQNKTYRNTKNNGNWTGWLDLSNADTIDGKHASDFVQLNGKQAVLPKQGGSEGGEILLEKADTSTLNGAGVLIDQIDNRIRIFENGSPWRGFYLDIPEGANNVATNLRNADMVDGFHVNTSVGGWGLKQIAGGTSDMSTGVSSLSQGSIYMVYE